ncbi:G-box-binding factor 1 isoform X2 [Phoenix dactylifera]|uniref:G-box-binding factor 1 isoform X2 n=1 Tax=Phoenix dactylifera TaxID=42345 RepID=A0A8B7CBG0_PHODC|nr:G-box-binding factor 1 isoform X2 [Phoenix dactylifera]
MGTGEQSIASAELSKTPISTGPPADPPPPPPHPPPLPPPAHSDGSTSAQALYSGLTAAASARIPVFHPPLAVSLPYPWGSQYPMPPCGTPIAYAPMYPHGGIYAQPAMATGSVYIAAEAERRLAEKKSKEESWNGGEGMKASSESAKEDASQSVNIESEGSSSTGLQVLDDRWSAHEDYVATRKKNIGKTLWDGGSMQHTGSSQNDNTTAESFYSAASLSPMAGRKERWHKHHWMLDERELKKQRRKQLNRESARRSRLRKQQQYQDLARRVDMLNGENCALRRELEQLDKHCKELDSENASIAEELSKIFH